LFIFFNVLYLFIPSAHLLNSLFNLVISLITVLYFVASSGIVISLISKLLLYHSLPFYLIDYSTVSPLPVLALLSCWLQYCISFIRSGLVLSLIIVRLYLPYQFWPCYLIDYSTVSPLSVLALLSHWLQYCISFASSGLVISLITVLYLLCQFWSCYLIDYSTVSPLPVLALFSNWLQYCISFTVLVLFYILFLWSKLL
jgi:hypothetical protein